jgi:hypothetical protein
MIKALTTLTIFSFGLPRPSTVTTTSSYSLRQWPESDREVDKPVKKVSERTSV